MLKENDICSFNLLKGLPISQKYKANFKGRPKVEKPFMLQYCVSLDMFHSIDNSDNDRQTGEGFAAFVDLVNKYKSQINKLKIILTDYLQRWYCGIDKATDLSDQWKKHNITAINHLQVPFEICSWKNYLDTQDYPLALKIVKQLYVEDQIFKEMVDEEVNKYKYKAVIHEEQELKRNAAKEYLFEECAVVLLFTGYLTYPGDLNKAIKYILLLDTKISMEFYPSPAKLRFFRHIIKKRNIAHHTDGTKHTLVNSCLHTTHLLKEHGIIETEAQSKFFSNFVSMLNGYLNINKDE